MAVAGHPARLDHTGCPAGSWPHNAAQTLPPLPQPSGPPVIPLSLDRTILLTGVLTTFSDDRGRVRNEWPSQQGRSDPVNDTGRVESSS